MSSSLAIRASIVVGFSIISGLESLEVLRIGIKHDSSLGCPRLLYLFLRISLKRRPSLP